MAQPPEPGQIIILNGAPRSGKSSIAATIQETFPGLWMNLGVDRFMQMTPARYHPGIGLRPGGERQDLEPIIQTLYGAMYESIAAHSRLGLNVVVDVGHHDAYAIPRGILVESARRLIGLPVLFVGVRCSLEAVLERRRTTGYLAGDPGETEAPLPIRRWQEAVHIPGIYDLEVDTSVLSPGECAALIRNRLDEGPPPTAFAQLAALAASPQSSGSNFTDQVNQVAPPVSSHLRLAHILSIVVIVLAALAAGVGLLNPTAYQRNPTALVPVLQGQDLVTLLMLPALGAALLRAWHGSARATLLWLGLLGYLCYTYTGAALGYAFSEWTLLYVAIFSLTIFALAAAVSGIDAAGIHEQFDSATPRRALAGFLVLIALMLALLEIGQNIGYLTSGVLPAGVVTAGGGAYFVYSLDLGIIVPLALLGAVWIWRRRPWGIILTGFMLVKAATMGLALLSMNWVALRAGQSADPIELIGFYGLLTIGGLGMAAWFFRHGHGSGRAR